MQTQLFQIHKITSHHVVDFAAEELKKYLRMMMPSCGEIAIAYTPDATTGFRLGLTKDFGIDPCQVENPRLDDLIYIETNEVGGILAGSNPRSVLLAVYQYLRENGCRWLFPGIDGEIIPIAQVKPISYCHVADHRYRGQCNEGAEYQQIMMDAIDFTPKVGLNTFMIEFDNPRCYYDFYFDHPYNPDREPEYVSDAKNLQWKRQCEVEIAKRGLLFHDMGHGWTAEPLGISSTKGWRVNTDDIPKETMGYLAEMNGKRDFFHGVPLNTNVCLSNPAVRRKMVTYIADYAEKQKHVDFLHIWMADGSNNHCECAACAQKTPSDWYMILMNEIDAELTIRNLDNHLVFIAYVDSIWAPLEETIRNSNRFSMLFAPIHRLYTETYQMEPDRDSLRPYMRNQNVFPRGMASTLAYLEKWKERWKGDCFCYEYHFWKSQYRDIGGKFIARILSEDVKGLAKHGLRGIVEDGSQRSAFPTGFPMYVYGQTLYDVSKTYEELEEDYFSHAFGVNWKKAAAYLDRLSELFDFSYFCLTKEADEDVIARLQQVKAVVEDFIPVIRENRNAEERAASVSWDLLNWHASFCIGLAESLLLRESGKQEEANKRFEELTAFLSPLELIRGNCYDHFLNIQTMAARVK